MLEGEYKPLLRTKGHALSIVSSTLRVEVRASGAVFLGSVFNIKPLRKTELESPLQESVKYSTESFGLSPGYSKTRVSSGVK